MFGLTFKAHTDDLRDSPSLAIVRELVAAGADVRAHDPTTIDGVRPSQQRHVADILDNVTIAPDPYQAAAGAAVSVVLTEWPEYAELDLERLAKVMAPLSAVVDGRNLLVPDLVRKAGLIYDGVGRS